MRISLSNDELVAFTELIRETVEKYQGMIEEMREVNKNRALKREAPLYDDDEVTEAMRDLAIFESLWEKLQERGFKKKGEYSFELKPVWCFAIRLEFNGLLDVTTQIGNSVQMLCNQIHQQYA